MYFFVILEIGGASPWDGYAYKGQLSTVWGIDSTILRFTSQMYLVWSRFSPNGLQSLYIATLSNPWTLGAANLLSEPTNAWERVNNPVNEGPAAMYWGGKTYLTYSASDCWTTSYQLGLLTYKGSGDPLLASSWTKSGPVFSSANGNLGTAHNGYVGGPPLSQDMLTGVGRYQILYESRWDRGLECLPRDFGRRWGL